MKIENLEKNLKSGEGLYFISANRISDCKWIRSPMNNKTETINQFLVMMYDPDYQDVNVQSETTLNEFVVQDDGVESHYTLREQLFGWRYQDRYEFFCEKFGVNLDEIKKFKSARAPYETQVAESKVS